MLITAQKVLLFEAGSVFYGVFLPEITRLIRDIHLLPVPFSHPGMAGIIVEGQQEIMPVFDLGLMLEKSSHLPVEGPTVASFQTERGPIGLLLTPLKGTITEYNYLSDRAREEELLAQVPKSLRHTVMGIGEYAGEHFFFFSPGAFLTALDLDLAARPGYS